METTKPVPLWGCWHCDPEGCNTPQLHGQEHGERPGFSSENVLGTRHLAMPEQSAQQRPGQPLAGHPPGPLLSSGSVPGEV